MFLAESRGNESKRMLRSYILVYSSQLGNPEEIKALLDSCEKILDWRVELPNTFFLVSQHGADALAKDIGTSRNYAGKFIILEVTSNKQGWLSKEAWHLLNKKKRLEA